jgi:putative tricarboxylic transport membrane protein
VKALQKIPLDVVSGAVLFVIALFYYSGTRNLPRGQGEPGPAFFPILLALALGALGLSILFQGIKKGTESEQEGYGFWKPGVTIVLTAVYVVVFPALGFAVSTWLYTLSVTVMFRKDRWLIPVVVPIVSTSLVYLLFRIGLGVRLPSGFLGLP